MGDAWRARAIERQMVHEADMDKRGQVNGQLAAGNWQLELLVPAA